LRKGFTETDHARLLDADHQQFAGPLVVVWDNLNAHVSAVLAELVTAQDCPFLRDTLSCHRRANQPNGCHAERACLLLQAATL